MKNNITLNEYMGFVDGVTSDASKDFDTFIARLHELRDTGVNIPRLLTGAIGMADEAGEAAGLVKKILFHGKPLNDENREHLIKELGDVIWYWINTCNALNIDPMEVIEGNVDKLSSRYPGGFSVWLSENRKKGDI